MSHFTVLVIGENPEEQLQPFHEFECTGINDQYIQEINKTEEYRKEYDEETQEMPFADWIEDYHGQKKVFSEKDIDLENEHKYGYVLCDSQNNVIRVIKRTNPNSHWDWYQLGGRWRGFFKVKEGAEAVVGEAGLFGGPVESGTGDSLLKSDIDFDLMRREAVEDAEKKYDLAMSILGELPLNEPWSKIGAEMNYSDEARAKYHAQARPVAWKEAEQNNRDNKSWPFGWSTSADDFIISREHYVKNAHDSAISTHAVIKDGKWYERGRMGWWAIVHDEKDTWNAEFTKLLDNVSDDTLLSVYDCHI